MILLLDYIKNRDPDDLAQDKLLQQADSRFMDELAQVVGTQHSEQAYALVMGGLLLRLLNGKQTSIDNITSWIEQLRKKN